MAERAVPIYQEAQSTQAMSTKGLDEASLLTVVRAKVDAGTLLEEWKPFLFPEDDDG